MFAHLQQVAAPLAERLHLQGATLTPERYMAAADIFCLPSYREGFGSSVLEAAACGVPSVATRIYGLTDAVEEDVTGLLVAPRDADALATALEKLIKEAETREQMGTAARARAITLFSQRRITEGLRRYYEQVLEDRMAA